MNNTTRVLLVAAIAVGLAACTKKVVPDAPTTQPTQPTQPAMVDDGKYGPEDLDTDACLKQRTVYFDLDQDSVKSEFQAILACHAKYLQDRPESRVTLEGHADERGSREYNLGLGERRGNAVSGALQAAGGSAGQQTVVSFGEERAVDTASTEEAWAKNRRVEIVYTAR